MPSRDNIRLPWHTCQSVYVLVPQWPNTVCSPKIDCAVASAMWCSSGLRLGLLLFTLYSTDIDKTIQQYHLSLRRRQLTASVLWPTRVCGSKIENDDVHRVGRRMDVKHDESIKNRSSCGMMLHSADSSLSSDQLSIYPMVEWTCRHHFETSGYISMRAYPWENAWLIWYVSASTNVVESDSFNVLWRLRRQLAPSTLSILRVDCCSDIIARLSNRQLNWIQSVISSVQPILRRTY